MLQGQVKVAADIAVRGHLVDQCLIGAVRVAVQHPQPFKAFHFQGRAAQQVLQTLRSQVASPAGGILGDQDLLLHALPRQALHFTQYIFHIPGMVAAPDEGDGAKGAAVVAALADAHIGCVLGRGQHAAAVQKRCLSFGIHAPLTLFKRDPDGFGQGIVLGDAAEHVDLGDLPHQILTVALGQAAGDHQGTAFARLLILRHLKDGIDGFFLGRGNKTAGVDHQHLRVLRLFGQLIAFLTQQGKHFLCIHTVLRASQRNNPNSH